MSFVASRSSLVLQAFCWAIVASTCPEPAFAQDPTPALIASFRRDAASCVRPPVTSSERLIVVGAADPQVMTNIVFAGQQDEAGLVQVNVRPGSERLALALLPEDDVIYAFADPTGRISRVSVLMQRGRNVGVTGVPRGAVDFVDFSSCREDLTDALAQAALGEGTHRARGRFLLTAAFDRSPDVVAVRNAATVSVPAEPADGAAVASSQPIGTIIYREGSSMVTRERVDVTPEGSVRRQPVETFSKSEIDPDFLVHKDAFPGGVRMLEPGLVLSSAPFAASRRAGVR